MKISKALFFFLFAAVLSPSAFALTATYDQKISMGGNVVATVKVAAKDDLLRAESNFSGMQTVMLRNKEGMFSYLPVQKVATKIPPFMDRPNVTRDIPKYMEFLKSNGGQKIGDEKVDGKDTEVYSFVEPNIKKPGKAWIWKEKQFPIKIEVQAPEGVTTIDIQNVNFQPSLKDEDFQLPKDTKIVNFPAPGQTPGAPQAGQQTAAPASSKQAKG